MGRGRPGSAAGRLGRLAVSCMVAALPVLGSPGPLLGQDEPPPDPAASEEAGASQPAGGEQRIARTREERRESGLKLEIGEWLTLSGLAELEVLYQRFTLLDSSDALEESDFSTTLELGIELTPLSWAKAELLYEYDGEHRLEEAILAFEAGGFELELGRLYVPFGEYFSHFITGPALEFGETRSSGAVLTYGLSDRLILSAFLHRGRAERIGSSGADVDWGLAVEGSPFESAKLALSFSSDLADSNEGILGDSDNKFAKRIAGLSAYTLFSLGRFEATGEFVLALDSFEELDPDRDEPRAWNVELAYFPQDALELAVRLEGSQELQDAPRTQGGISAAWRVMKNAYLRIEYLHGAFERGLANDPNEMGLDRVHQIGAQLTLQ